MQDAIEINQITIGIAASVNEIVLKYCPTCRVSDLSEIEKEYALKYGNNHDVEIVKKDIKSKAIREFAEKLRRESLLDRGYEILQEGVIENLVKEMIGDTNAETQKT